MSARKPRDARVAHKSDRWTADCDAELNRLREAGATINEIAHAMQRTSNGIAERLKYLRRKDRKETA